MHIIPGCLPPKAFLSVELLLSPGVRSAHGNTLPAQVTVARVKPPTQLAAGSLLCTSFRCLSRTQKQTEERGEFSLLISQLPQRSAHSEFRLVQPSAILPGIISSACLLVQL